uniref:HipA family kinase n=1 Tax=uncultured Halomonas sp. TaxID=173971 RepID=UPI00262FCFDB|nr:HipA family kinase [uncultured Halomonas sp.]
MMIQRTLVAEEVLRPTEQGRSRPFLVRDTEGDIYVVKGVDGAGRPALISELICAELGNRCELPIPDHGIMEISPVLLAHCGVEKAYELGGGPAFASLLLEQAAELRFSQVSSIDEVLQQRVLLFDIWVNNGDRQLTDLGGNVNLLITPEYHLAVIDHNVALLELETPDWTKRHVFSGQTAALDDLVVRESHISVLDSALSDWDTIIDLLPDEWVYRDQGDDTTPSQPTLKERYQWLSRLNADDIWRNQ